LLSRPWRHPFGTALALALSADQFITANDRHGIGLNGRLDTIQAAILIEKLSVFADEIRA
jgi:dTDP-4-amino-4,6-dideoxygalactose transaminase